FHVRVLYDRAVVYGNRCGTLTRVFDRGTRLESSTPHNIQAEETRKRKTDKTADLRAWLRVVPFIITLVTAVLAAAFTRTMWRIYMERAWTRDSVVRTYIVTMAPEVAGRIVELPVVD